MLNALCQLFGILQCIMPSFILSINEHPERLNLPQKIEYICLVNMYAQPFVQNEALELDERNLSLLNDYLARHLKGLRDGRIPAQVIIKDQDSLKHVKLTGFFPRPDIVGIPEKSEFNGFVYQRCARHPFYQLFNRTELKFEIGIFIKEP
jgi:hypothetical protein